MSADLKPLPEPKDGELVMLGRWWNENGGTEARAEFMELADHMLKSGQASRVIDDCHLLVGEVSEPSSEIVAELVVLIQKARDKQVTGMG